uniref:Uncharacterized protein n=1 Tax=Arundo donax TaxID=35708 RepID=A0A0A8XWZ7_ARUDO
MSSVENLTILSKRTFIMNIDKGKAI